MRQKYLGVISLLYSIIIIYLYFNNKLKCFLAPNMINYLIISSIFLIIIGVVLLFNKANNKFKTSDLVLVLPLIVLLISGDGRLNTSLASNRVVSNTKKDSNIVNKDNKNNSTKIDTTIIDNTIETIDDKIDFNLTDSTYVDIANYLGYDENSLKYKGKIIRIRGFIVDYVDGLPDGYYAIGKYGVSCCVADANFVGLIFKYDGKIDPDEWYEVEGTLEEYPYNKYMYLSINATSARIIDGMKEEQYVYPCYAYGDGTCSDSAKYDLN